jgi:hypothetical protein
MSLRQQWLKKRRRAPFSSQILYYPAEIEECQTVRRTQEGWSLASLPRDCSKKLIVAALDFFSKDFQQLRERYFFKKAKLANYQRVVMQKKFKCGDISANLKNEKDNNNSALSKKNRKGKNGSMNLKAMAFVYLKMCFVG